MLRTFSSSRSLFVTVVSMIHSITANDDHFKRLHEEDKEIHS